MERPPRYNRTTNRRWGHRARRWNPATSLFGISALLAFFAFLAFSGGNGSSPEASLLQRGLPEPCIGANCPRPASAEGGSTPIPPPPVATACPYCDQDPQRWRGFGHVEPPQIYGMAAAVLEGSCGTLIYGVRHTDRLVPASLTKMATAMVVAENRALTERVDITQNGWWLASTDGSSIMGLEEGMNLSVRDLLVGMLLPSGNDAALQLAEYMGGTPVIVRLMNQRVQQMGLTNTFFVNPDGRDATPGNYSTALDMALIGREMMANPILREIAGTPLIHPEWSGHALWNANYLVHSYPGAFGVKSGYTDLARETLVGGVVWEGRELYVSILGSNFVYYDAFALLDWAYDHTTPVC